MADLEGLTARFHPEMLMVMSSRLVCQGLTLLCRCVAAYVLISFPLASTWADPAALASARPTRAVVPDSTPAEPEQCSRRYPEQMSEVRINDELNGLRFERDRVDADKRALDGLKGDVEAYVVAVTSFRLAPSAESDAKSALAKVTEVEPDVTDAKPLEQCNRVRQKVRAFGDKLWWSYAPPNPNTGLFPGAVRMKMSQASSGPIDPPEFDRIWAFARSAVHPNDASADTCSKSELKEVQAALQSVVTAGVDTNIKKLIHNQTDAWRNVATEIDNQLALLDGKQRDMRACVDLLEDKVLERGKTTDSVIGVVFPLIIALGLLYLFTRVFPVEVQQSLIRTRTLVEVVGIAFLLITVITLGGAGKLQAESLGTLLGSIATYIFGRQLFGAGRNANDDGPGGQPSPPREAAAPADSTATGAPSRPSRGLERSEVSYTVATLIVAFLILTYAAVEGFSTIPRAATTSKTIVPWIYLLGALASVACSAFLLGSRSRGSNSGGNPSPPEPPSPG